MSDATVILGWTPPGGTERRRTFTRRCRIGRSPENDVVFAAPDVSRHHAVLELSHGALVVRNVSASRPVQLPTTELGPGAQTRLGVGDTLRLGSCRLQVLDVVAADAPGRSVVCVNTSCRRAVQADATDCPWCGTSLAFAKTLPDPSWDRR